MGAIEEGEGMYVNVTFDATGYGQGTYFTDLDLMTNELAPDNERLIACEMFAYTPATLYGMVTDCDNGLPLSNVTVFGKMVCLVKFLQAKQMQQDIMSFMLTKIPMMLISPSYHIAQPM